MTMTRRQFLRAAGGAAAATAATAMPWAPGVAFAAAPNARAAAELTTLAQTLRAGAKGALGYRAIATGPGEPHVVREELAKALAGRAKSRTSLLSFLHLTDQHIIDVQSPTRVEFLDRYSDNDCAFVPFQSAHRPQEAACARIADAMNRRFRKIAVSPVTGDPVAAAICTGDNTDNQQINELDLFLALMNGGRAKPNSGDPNKYEGVQSSGRTSYWHPDPKVNDFYKRNYGFPSSKGWLEKALAPFDAVGVGVPWFTCYGNHDGLAQGNAPVNPLIDRFGIGATKILGLPDGVNPCENFANFGDVPGAPFMTVTPDLDRAYISREDWIAKHLEAGGKPFGHGFTQANVDRNLAYYAADVGPLRFITLDTVNPGGLDSGSIGEAQLTWLVAELSRAQKREQMVILFSHHGLRSLDNENEAPDPLEPEKTDLPRHRADEVMARISEFSCIIAWVNGHSHENIVEPKGAFWDIGTAAHIDWPAQSRIIDVVDNRDGTLSIFGTLFDHEDEPIASFARELGGNDPQKGFEDGRGRLEDRNVELLLDHPFPGSSGGGSGPGAGGGKTGVGTGGGGVGAGGAGRELPATGGVSALTLVGAAAVAIGGQVLRARERGVAQESSAD